MRRSASATGARTTTAAAISGPVTLTTGTGQVDQHHSGPPRPGLRPRQDRRDGARRWASPANCASPARCRSAPPRSRCSTWPAPMRSSPMAATGPRPMPSPRSSTAAARSSTTAASDDKPPERVLPEEVVADMNGMLVQVPEWGTGRARQARRHPHGRQDRHHLGLPRRLVLRFHRQLCRRRLVRQRQLHPDPPPDRRQPAGADLARDHDLSPTTASISNRSPIIENPFEKPPTGAAVAAAEPSDDGAAADAGRPATLSAATTERLLAIEQLLRKASRLKPLAALAPPLPAALDAKWPAQPPWPASHAGRPLVCTSRPWPRMRAAP